MALSKRIHFDGKSWPYDVAPSIAEARLIKAYTGMRPLEWERAMLERDPDAIAALIHMLRKRDGEDTLKFSDVDGDMASFEVRVYDGEREVDSRVEGEGDDAREVLFYVDNPTQEYVDPTPEADGDPS